MPKRDVASNTSGVKRAAKAGHDDQEDAAAVRPPDNQAEGMPAMVARGELLFGVASIASSLDGLSSARLRIPSARLERMVAPKQITCPRNRNTSMGSPVMRAGTTMDLIG